MLTSCAGVSPTRIIGNTVAAAGGAFIGNKLSNGNPLITTAAAGGGVLLSESLQAQSNASSRKSYDAGYDKARSDSAKQQYQTLNDRQRFGPQGDDRMHVRLSRSAAAGARGERSHSRAEHRNHSHSGVTRSCMKHIFSLVRRDCILMQRAT